MVIPFLVYDCNRAVNLVGVEQLSAHELCCITREQLQVMFLIQ